MDRRSHGDDPETRRDRLVARLREAGHLERPETATAMAAVPREAFVPDSQRANAYDDRPLPIGADQTVSAPHMVAAICDLLELNPDDEVLEIGTGCGYHAAVTAEIVGDDSLCSVEYVERLADGARVRLRDLGYDVAVRVGDGHEGWPERAPFDAAYLTCAAAAIPNAVREQVRVGGRLVAPIGRTSQTLVAATKTPDGLDRETHGSVRFVPMQADEEG